jgi:hypothetical protein
VLVVDVLVEVDVVVVVELDVLVVELDVLVVEDDVLVVLVLVDVVDVLVVVPSWHPSLHPSQPM